MEFQFGTNWAAYSRYVGDIFDTTSSRGSISLFRVSFYWIVSFR
ncbi:cytochrome ubiquinol oxidase subunit I [Anaerobacillus sp. HL2]|nr:cytochrome ubiquinol oxidase subunit I [Anaerobacillus sp. HL2]